MSYMVKSNGRVRKKALNRLIVIAFAAKEQNQSRCRMEKGK